MPVEEEWRRVWEGLGSGEGGRGEGEGGREGGRRGKEGGSKEGWEESYMEL